MDFETDVRDIKLVRTAESERIRCCKLPSPFEELEVIGVVETVGVQV